MKNTFCAALVLAALVSNSAFAEDSSEFSCNFSFLDNTGHEESQRVSSRNTSSSNFIAIHRADITLKKIYSIEVSRVNGVVYRYSVKKEGAILYRGENNGDDFSSEIHNPDGSQIGIDCRH